MKQKIDDIINRWLAPSYEHLEPEFRSDLNALLREVTVKYADHVLKASGYPVDLQTYVGLPGMFDQWLSEKEETK